MKILKLMALLAAVAITFSNCKKDKKIEIDSEFKSTMDFMDLKIGQKSYYTSYTTTCDDYSGNLGWTGDTIILEVVDFRDETFTLQETYTAGSKSFQGQTLPEPLNISVVFENDYILLPDRFSSNFFWFYGNDTLHLQPAQTVGLVQDECGLVLESEPFIGNDIGTVSSFKVDDIELKDKIAVSCVPGFFEVDAYLIYHDKSLQASHVIQGGENVRGWMQLGL